MFEDFIAIGIRTADLWWPKRPLSKVRHSLGHGPPLTLFHSFFLMPGCKFVASCTSFHCPPVFPLQVRKGCKSERVQIRLSAATKQDSTLQMFLRNKVIFGQRSISLPPPATINPTTKNFEPIDNNTCNKLLAL